MNLIRTCIPDGDQACPPTGIDVETTRALVAAHRGPVIVDFDETLYLRNSTEDFLDSARPGWLAKIILKGLDIVKPWRFTGGNATRDNWRVIVLGLLLPWVWLVWQWRAPRLAREWRNAELIEDLRENRNVIVASIGFHAIIAPLLKAIMRDAAPPLVACRVLTSGDRIAGKRALLARSHGEAFIRESLVVTDSPDDTELLEICACPCLTIWPKARWREALSGVYLPFEYLSRVKRPGSRYVWTSIIQEDYAFWILASLGAGIAFGLHAGGLALLLISFWAVYETGYVDNDRIASRFEVDPKLSTAFSGHQVATPDLAPWIWASITGYLGLAVLAGSWLPSITGMIAWASVLTATFLCFRVFNRIDKRSRIWLFGFLQMARISAFAAVLPISIMGAAGLAAHFVALWVPYLVYRLLPDKDWPEFPVFTMRLFCFVIFGGLMALATPLAMADIGIAAAFLAWNLLRTRKELPRILRQVHRIDATEGKA
jgi:hypothetical protein